MGKSFRTFLQHTADVGCNAAFQSRAFVRVAEECPLSASRPDNVDAEFDMGCIELRILVEKASQDLRAVLG